MAAPPTFEDLSGTSAVLSADQNPYNVLIDASDNDPTRIQARYAQHRTTRALQQRSLLLSPTFTGVSIDPTLRALLDEEARPPSSKQHYTDPRHCLVFWARPPPSLQSLIHSCQLKLQTTIPSLWLMPRQNLHLTALEITHSRPNAAEIDVLVDNLLASASEIIQLPAREDCRPRLIKPMISYDAAAIALSFLPDERAGYTYHHLRRDLWDLASRHVQVGSRYVVPSAHLTIARFVTEQKKEDVAALVAQIDEVNAWLERTYWGAGDGEEGDGGTWTVGLDRGLDFRRGTLWYGGGSSIL